MPYFGRSAGAKYVRDQLSKAVTEAVAGNGKMARLEAGRGLHAIEDLLAHSNYVDLNMADRATVTNAVWNAAVAPPATLRLTGYNNAPTGICDAVGLPPGDARPHDNFAVDRDGLNAYSGTVTNVNGVMRTRHVHARGFAVGAATDFLNRLNLGLTPAQRGTIRVALATEAGPDEADYQWAALQPYDPNGFTASFDGNSVVFPPKALAEDVRAGLLGATVNIVGHEEEAIVAPTGERMVVFRDIRPVDDPFPTSAEVQVRFNQSEVTSLVPGTLDVFFADPDSEVWSPVLGASVFESLGEAEFTAGHGGIYALGGIPIPDPSTLLLVITGGLITPASRGRTRQRLCADQFFDRLAFQSDGIMSAILTTSEKSP